MKIALTITSFVIAIGIAQAAAADTLFSSNDETVCETIYGPFFTNTPATDFFCEPGTGNTGTICTSSTGILQWDAYPVWSDTLLPVEDNRERQAEMLMHCDITYMPK
jgi:hypothetical protein